MLVSTSWPKLFAFTSSQNSLRDLVIDVGSQEGQAHFPHRFCDVGVTQLPIAAQRLENTLQLFSKKIEGHGTPTLSAKAGLVMPFGMPLKIIASWKFFDMIIASNGI